LNTKQAQEGVNIFLSYHFGEERFRIYDPKGVIKEHFNTQQTSRRKRRHISVQEIMMK
jgi:hypothetical protein